MKTSTKVSVLAAAALGLVTHSANAVLVFNLGTVITGDSPSGSAPWLRATFTQVDGTHVDLLLETLQLTGNENVKDWAFNTTFADVSTLSAVERSRVGLFKPEPIMLDTSVNTPGGFSFDFDFDFQSGGQLDKTFSQGDSVTMRLYRASGLSEADFNITAPYNSNNPNQPPVLGPFLSGAHIQNTSGAEGSGTIGAVVPEPSTYFAAALLAIPGIFALGKALPRRGKEKQQ